MDTEHPVIEALFVVLSGAALYMMYCTAVLLEAM